ncbi:DUF927 domain-containing protein [Salmonella enterica subsp. enterica serovar Nijmegen]|nr:DUF927 domain-containing protein [Salmonella enterica subsp. enterica serovar Nijmegen]EDS4505166.1 DUF927 domain-containing protein [Salmonella enterica subsp. enterica serovar Nijmegen]EDS4840653.1 DUF927 domain-containing protein [Salmonella enterica subsp. enterica serovar Nijmegen]EDU1012199.1 DUF927 domain-containing protein [Salmonella enterica subsp. enterica serovar Nijmegen]EDU1067387.1 DUF927 domain-containing protein [Salmonella enterica subsp. enterica serovar Nijmegen]
MEQGQKRTPARFTANSFSDLCNAILSHRVQISITSEMTDEERRKEKQKLYWFSAPTQKAGQRRIVANMAACAFGSLDIDESTPGAIKALTPVLTRRSVMVYTTASHTAEAPRLRIVCELSRPIEPAERGAILTAVETMLMQSAGFTFVNLEGQKSRWEKGSDYVALDRSVYGQQSYLYCPHKGAKVQTYAGEVIDVDALSLPAGATKTKKSTSKDTAEKQPQQDAEVDDMSTAPDAFVIGDLRSALSFPKWQNPSDDYETWIGNGIRLASLKGTEYEDEAKTLWFEYSARSPANNPEFTEEKWETFNAERSSYRGIFADSQNMGWVNEATKRAATRMQPRVEARTDGLYHVTPRVNKQTGEVEEPSVWLCSPVEVIGRGTDGGEEYLVLSWLCNGQKVTEALPLCDIGEREGWRRMKAGGMNVTSKSSLRAVLGDHLQLCGEQTRWNVAKTTGWQHGAYIMPDGEIIGTASKPVILCGHSATAQGYTVKGSPESWRDNVARLAAGNPSMVTAIAAAFAAPMLSLVGADGFGIHFYEQSSAGKTTTANTAASIYGSPDKTKLTWYGTALGMVNEAAAHNDGFMSLDEISQNTRRRDVAESAYALFNGVGKLQGRREGGNREILRYTTVALSTGETDLESFIREDGGNVNAGQLVRLLNIPLTRATSFHTLPDGKAHADALKSAYQSHYGAVGRKWVSMLADNPKAAQDAVAVAKTRWKSLLSTQHGEQAGRVADCFAILEAALVLSQSLTGWDIAECRAAVEHNFRTWVALYGAGNREFVQVVEMVENFLLVNESRFDVIAGSESEEFPTLSTDKIRRAGWLALNGAPDGRNVYYVLPGVFKAETIPGKEHVQAAKILHEEGVLWKKTKDRYTSLTPRINGQQYWTYALMLVPVVEGEESEAAPETDLI